MSRTAIITQAYPLNLLQKGILQQRINHLKELSLDTGQQLREKLWTEKWLEGLQDNKQKAYKVIDERQVQAGSRYF